MKFLAKLSIASLLAVFSLLGSSAFAGFEVVECFNHIRSIRYGSPEHKELKELKGKKMPELEVCGHSQAFWISRKAHQVLLCENMRNGSLIAIYDPTTERVAFVSVPSQLTPSQQSFLTEVIGGEEAPQAILIETFGSHNADELNRVLEMMKFKVRRDKLRRGQRAWSVSYRSDLNEIYFDQKTTHRVLVLKGFELR